jgi:hypothetical protein
LFPAGRSEPTSGAKHGEAHDRIPSVVQRAGLMPQRVYRVLKAIDPYGFGLHSPPLVWLSRPVLNYL